MLLIQGRQRTHTVSASAITDNFRQIACVTRHTAHCPIKTNEEKEPDICSLIRRETIILGAFRAAKLLRTSDYIFMRSMRFDDIPKRRSFHLLPLELPECVTVHDGEDEEFMYDWAVEFVSGATRMKRRRWSTFCFSVKDTLSQEGSGCRN